jgi:hypothetical protein
MADSGMDKLRLELRERCICPLDADQKVIVRALLEASLIAAMDAVAEEAVKGEDVSGAVDSPNGEFRCTDPPLKP